MLALNQTSRIDSYPTVVLGDANQKLREKNVDVKALLDLHLSGKYRRGEISPEERTSNEEVIKAKSGRVVSVFSLDDTVRIQIETLLAPKNTNFSVGPTDTVVIPQGDIHSALKKHGETYDLMGLSGICTVSVIQ